LRRPSMGHESNKIVEACVDAKTIGNLDEEDDPSQPSRFISEALRVASSIEKTSRWQTKECHRRTPASIG
jgi:hypothetical protein